MSLARQAGSVFRDFVIRISFVIWFLAFVIPGRWLHGAIRWGLKRRPLGPGAMRTTADGGPPWAFSTMCFSRRFQGQCRRGPGFRGAQFVKPGR